MYYQGAAAAIVFYDISSILSIHSVEFENNQINTFENEPMK
jgi:hypothetical protein